MHKNVQFVRLQWRNLGEGEWINAWDMNGNDADIWKNDIVDGDVQCAASRGAGCEMKWNLERQYFFNGKKTVKSLSLRESLLFWIRFFRDQ